MTDLTPQSDAAYEALVSDPESVTKDVWDAYIDLRRIAYGY